MNKKENISKGILVWCWLLVLLPLGFSILGYIDPLERFSLEVSQDNYIYLGGSIGLYLARNIASVIVTYYAIYCRSADMIIMACLLRIATDLFDVINRSLAGYMDMEHAIFAPIWIIGSGIVIYKLSTSQKHHT